MARDYGNKRSISRRNNMSHQFLVAVVAFLFGYLAAAVVDIKTLSHWVNTQVLAPHEEKALSVASTPKTAEVPPKPKFEFYTLLANEKVPSGLARSKDSANTHQHAVGSSVNPPVVSKVPPQANQLNKVLASSAVVSAKVDKLKGLTAHPVQVAEGTPLKSLQDNKTKYVVQVAAFKARQDADRMKGLLILKGYNVSVVPVSHARGNWFRVVIGPYPDKALAQQAQVHIANVERLKGVINRV